MRRDKISLVGHGATAGVFLVCLLSGCNGRNNHKGGWPLEPKTFDVTVLNDVAFSPRIEKATSSAGNYYIVVRTSRLNPLSNGEDAFIFIMKDDIWLGILEKGSDVPRNASYVSPKERVLSEAGSVGLFGVLQAELPRNVDISDVVAVVIKYKGEMGVCRPIEGIRQDRPAPVAPGGGRQ